MEFQSLGAGRTVQRATQSGTSRAARAAQAGGPTNPSGLPVTLSAAPSRRRDRPAQRSTGAVYVAGDILSAAAERPGPCVPRALRRCQLEHVRPAPEERFDAPRTFGIEEAGDSARVAHAESMRPRRREDAGCDDGSGGGVHGPPDGSGDLRTRGGAAGDVDETVHGLADVVDVAESVRAYWRQQDQRPRREAQIAAIPAAARGGDELEHGESGVVDASALSRSKSR